MSPNHRPPENEHYEMVRWAADKHRAAISCKVCGGLPFGSTLVGETCTCPPAVDAMSDDDPDDDYCVLCGAYLSGDFFERHETYPDHCVDCGEDQAFLDGDDNAYDHGPPPAAEGPGR